MSDTQGHPFGVHVGHRVTAHETTTGKAEPLTYLHPTPKSPLIKCVTFARSHNYSEYLFPRQWCKLQYLFLSMVLNVNEVNAQRSPGMISTTYYHVLDAPGMRAKGKRRTKAEERKRREKKVLPSVPPFSTLHVKSLFRLGDHDDSRTQLGVHEEP